MFDFFQVHHVLKCICFGMMVSSLAWGQQTNVSTPFAGTSDSFYENFGVHFGFSLPGGQGPGSRVVGFNGFGITPNLNFSQNSFGSAVPAIGGYVPGSGARFGFARRTGNGTGFSLGFEFAQGSTRTLSSTSPSVTLLNGGIGSISSGAVSPFVTGVVPVVGSGQVIDNAVTRGIASGQLRPYSESRVAISKMDSSAHDGRLAASFEGSSATTSDIGVAEIKAQKALAEANRKRQLQQSIDTAKRAYESEDYRNARIELRKAIKLSNDDPMQQKKLKAWMKTLRGK